jgi:hypothetical protein
MISKTGKKIQKQAISRVLIFFTHIIKLLITGNQTGITGNPLNAESLHTESIIR